MLEEDIFQIKDEKLYEEICEHPKCLSISSSVVLNNENKEFKYVYADDPRYELGQGSFGRVLVCFY